MFVYSFVVFLCEIWWYLSTSKSSGGSKCLIFLKWIKISRKEDYWEAVQVHKKNYLRWCQYSLQLLFISTSEWLVISRNYFLVEFVQRHRHRTNLCTHNWKTTPSNSEQNLYQKYQIYSFFLYPPSRWSNPYHWFISTNEFHSSGQFKRN